MVKIMINKMIDRKDFDLMQEEMEDFDNQREELIKKSRDVLKLSKQIIYALHRNEIDNAGSLVKEIKQQLKTLDDFIKKKPKMYHQGSYKVAVQEYVEALLFFEFMKDRKLATRKELNVDTDYYLLGLCDLSGELARKAIQAATKEDYTLTLEVKEIVEHIYNELLKFDIRESELRRKFDSIKYDLKRLEDLCLELKLKDKV